MKYATLSKVEISLNGITKSATLSGTSVSSQIIDFGIVNSSSDLTASISVIDSRGNKTSYSKNVTIADWVQPSAIITCKRENNFYSTTHLTVDGNISSLNDKNEMTIQYQYKKTSDTDYSSLKTIQENTQTNFDIDNKYSWNIRVIISDKLASTSYNLFVDKGIPIVYFDRLLSSMGVNCFPKYDNSFEVNGVSLSGKVLYNSANGTAETVTLSDNAENYTYLEIFYRSSGDNACGSVKVFSPNGKLVHLGTIHYIADYDYAKFALVSVSGSTIKFSQNYQIVLKNNGSTYSAENAIFITRVVGY